MFKKVKKCLALLTLPLALSYLSSCSFFTSSKKDEGYLIKSIETEKNEDGSTKVTITYNDEEMEPVVFFIPKGEQGEQGEIGNGIAGIENKGYDETGSYTIMEITYTDTSLAPVIFKVPNGVSIDSMESTYNESSGITTVIIKLTNGETLTFDLPRGKDGQNGIGIIYIDYKTNEDNSIEMEILLSDGSSYIVTIPAGVKGNDGRGIQTIVGTEDDDNYVLVIYYTDNTSETIEFSKPEDPNTWLSGQGAPTNDLGANGDFYFDTYNKNIYGKSSGAWVLIHSFSDSGETYDVKFKLNDSVDAPATMVSELVYKIERGSYFASSGYTIPIPTRVGYEFNGWYTVPNPGPTNGVFTDLTPVFSDLTLYASWSVA